MRAITAKYAGQCDSCGERIEIGDRIYWARGEPSRHTRCPDPAPAAPRELGWEETEYAAGVADYEREKFNRETFGEAYAAAEELAWMYKTGEGM
jgi:hypothetical protein